MTTLLNVIASWHTLLCVILVFGFAPGFVLRLLVRIYPRDDPRRQELVAELYALKHISRPLFVAQQLETVLFEGVPHRVRAWRLKRSSDPWTQVRQLSYGLISFMILTPPTITVLVTKATSQSKIDVFVTASVSTIVIAISIGLPIIFRTARRMHKITEANKVTDAGVESTVGNDTEMSDHNE